MEREFEQEYKMIGLKIAYYRKAPGMYKPISLTTLLRIAQALDVPAYKFLQFD